MKLMLLMFVATISIAGLMFVSGCKASAGAVTAEAARPINNIGKSTARIIVRADAIASEAKELPESRPQLVIVENAGAIKTDATEADAELDKAQVNMSLMAGTINNLETEKAVLEARIADLNSRFIGPRGVRWMWIIISTIVAAGFLSTFIGVASPSGWGLYISRAINSNIMLPFVWARDLLLRLRGLRVGAVPKPFVKA